jgi:group II intron reverse transcriptase/maturase
MVYKVLNKLESLNSRNKKNKFAVNKDLYRLICDEQLLVIAYNTIKSKQGNMTPGPDNETLDGTSPLVIREIIESLKNQTFEFKPVRRIFIPKGNTNKMRPLGIPSPKDKIVQKALLIIMERIYEPCFHDSSHGFRPGRSCHSALKQIRKYWSGMKWAVEGDIKGCYDNVNHHILINLLRKKIQDERFINLIWKLLRAGIVEDGQFRKTNIGTPQGGILSPLLANIYLNELDTFIIDKLQLAINTNNKRSVDPEYNRLRSRIDWLKTRIKSKSLGSDKTLLKSLKKEQRLVPAAKAIDPLFKKIYYIRYADDWIIGVIGNKELANDIKLIVKEFLLSELKLELSSEKTKISHFPSGDIKFLGFNIKSGGQSEQSSSNLNKRTVGWQVRLFCPTDLIVDKLANNNFSTKLGRGIRKKGWITYPDDIITTKYNYILRGLRNYYSPCDNYGTSFNRIQYILKYSWAHTLASKHRTSIATQLKRVNKLKLDIERPLTNNIWNFKPSETDPDKAFRSYSRRTILLTSDSCLICGKLSNLEMHHLRALRKDGVNLEDKYMRGMMQRMNRKQICVCRSCHMDIHYGRYDGTSLKILSALKKGEN